MLKHTSLVQRVVSLLFLATSVGCVPENSSSPASDEESSNPMVIDEESSTSISANEHPSSSPTTDQEQIKSKAKNEIKLPTSWVRLGKQEEIWIDTKAKEVIIAGIVCLDQGPLEMFICPEGTKEHESVISANALSSQVHAALIALGADPGKSTSWDPGYRAAYGPIIDVTLLWHDVKTKKDIKMSAKQWIRNVETKKPMAHQWVFGGSQFWEDPDTGEQVYYGDSGELICLSNFSTATIDVNVESSESNAGLLFEALTENIPPVGTKVYAIIKPGKRIEPANEATGSEPADTQEKQVGQDLDSKSGKPENING